MKKALSIALSVLMTVGIFTILPRSASAADYGLKKPVVKGDVVTWNCVYFGSYYISGEKKKEPIKWRVLSLSGSDAFLLADKSVDCKMYNNADADVTWQTCSLRGWLNGSFYNAAFGSKEKSAIKTVNVKSVTYDGYVNTKDKIYLLSCEEAENAAFGFTDKDDTRISKNTEYTTSLGAYTYEYDDRIVWSVSSEGEKYNGSGYWWLRDSNCDGRYYNYASYVWKDGNVDERGNRVNDSTNAVRPCIHIDLSSSAWSYAGTVSSDGSFSCAVHSWDKGTVTKKPTYKTKGEKVRTCTVCGATKTETIAKLKAPTVAKVSVLTASKTTKAAIKLKWNAAKNATKYQIYRSTDGGKNWKKIAAAAKTTYTDKNVKAGAKYQYKVRGIHEASKATGAFSAVLKTGTVTAAPKIGKLTSTKSKTATVTWGKVTGAKSYIVYKSADGKTFKAVKTGVTKTTYTITGLKAGKKVYVKVIAVNAFGVKSAASAAKSVTVKKSADDSSVYVSSGYVLNTNSGIFHRSSCASVKRMSAANKKTVNWSRSKCISEGYTPCKVCKP